MLLKRKKKIEKENFKGKVALVRCDFNVSLDKDGEIKGDMRLRQALPTVKYLAKKGAKVVLLSHFSPADKSIYPVKLHLERLLKKEILFIDDCVGENVRKKIGGMEKGEILLLENVRKYKEEKESSLEFGKKLASLGDVFINDAFSVSHRDHASVTKIPLFLPSMKGFLMEKELEVLNKVKENPVAPVVVIVGGAKIESKISVVDYFLKNADHVLLGGKIANMMLIVRGVAFNMSWPSKEIERAVKEIDYTSPKMHIPVDVIASPDSTGRGGVRETAPAKIDKGEDVFDIGTETRKLYGDILKEAATIIWAGPLGFSEEKAFEAGTKEVGEMIVKNKKALKVVGGGDTGKTLQDFGLLKKFDFVSYGGGAMLAYVSNSPMPGLEILKK
jgi:phosphoglycerate kinase